ncbi:MAG: DUF4892 domain-containing protein [Pseudomonadales bacterium]
MSSRTSSALAFLLLFLTLPADAQQDAPGATDPAAIGARFPGAVIKSQTSREFDEYHLITGPVRRKDEIETGERLEGRITTTVYEIPKVHSTLEVVRNYENKLAEVGFETLFGCADQDCGGRSFNLTVVPYIPGFGGNESGQRYLAARRASETGSTYASVYITKNASVGGSTKDLVYVRLVLVDVEEMRSQLVVVDAKEMQREIETSGRVALYGILFKFASAEILPESKEALSEIAKLMNEDPDLQILVVGHTDNAGSHEYNMDLSQRRAVAVRAALVADYAVSDARLSAHGVGFLAPVATNSTEAGRARNRRVELVAR